MDKKDIEAFIALQRGKVQPGCSSGAGCVAEKGIIVGHVENQSPRKSTNNILGTAADAVKWDTTGVTAPHPLMWALVLQAMWLTKLIVLTQLFIHVVSA